MIYDTYFLCINNDQFAYLLRCDMLKNVKFQQVIHSTQKQGRATGTNALGAEWGICAQGSDHSERPGRPTYAMYIASPSGRGLDSQLIAT